VLEGLFVVTTGMHSFSVLPLLLQRLDLAGASQHPSTPDIDVALLLEVRNLEMAKHGNTIVIGVVVVPLVAVRVNEEDVVRKIIVVVDDVAGVPRSAHERI
jgi:hypothetical protein